ncbi:hypothetical protein QN277_021022 [Acacia crassicarpa]|uniref:Uncharacterized protein n=1 Tax=Acacia crassicarpa TaxID=499986 RepID=A0AAE1MLL6_9FABA|nr:hypothetical protein QN277_021022 [Acacia crassicarpa]
MSTLDQASDSYDRGTAPSSDSSFDLQNSLYKLEEQKRILRESEEAKRKRALGGENPKIQKVQPYLRNREHFAQYYSPKLVSIGPIHGGDKESREKLKGGERYKMTWAAMYLEFTKQSAQSLFDKIRTELPALMELYTEEVIEGFRGNNNKKKQEELAWMFLLDGCAVLEFIRNLEEGNAKAEEKLKIKVDQMVLVQQDLLLLENQLPYRLLTLLSNKPEIPFNQWIVSFLEKHPMTPSTTTVTGSSNGAEEVKITLDGNQPPHLLHLLRQSIFENKRNKDEEGDGCREHDKFPTYRNIQELRAAGIAVTKWKGKDKRLTDIAFHRGISLRPGGIGKLKLSPLTVDDLMQPTFLNLIAYEMCPDFKNGYEISSYVAFMDSLIDHADDVKQLRKAGILHNVLGSDEEVAHVFNTISTDLMPDTDRYRYVRTLLEERYKTMRLTWLAQAVHDHFSSPWAFLGFVAAIVALLLTFVQTWYTIYAPPSNDTHPPPPPPHT